MQAEHKGNTRGARELTAYAFIIIYSKRQVAQKVRACTGLPKTYARRRFKSCPVSIAFCIYYILLFSYNYLFDDIMSILPVREDREDFILKTTDYETTETIPVERLDARSAVVTGASTAGVP